MNSLLKPALGPMLLAAGLLVIGACDSADPVAASSNAAEASGTAKATDWLATVSETPEGGFVMGNPDARVKLVEFGSFTCSHCRDFHADAVAHLQPEYVKTGKVSYEFRPFILNIYDFAATGLAMCQGADKFFRWSDELYDNQDSWIEPFTKIKEDDVKALRNQSVGAQVVGLAKAGNFDVFAARRGVAASKFDECIGNETLIDALARRQQETAEKLQIQGTPTFLLNGKKVDNTTTWDQLKPRIDAALS